MKLGRALFVSFLASLFIAHKNTIALKICLHFQEQIGTRNCISKHLAIANKLSCIDKTKKFICNSNIIKHHLFRVCMDKFKTKGEKKNPRQGLNRASLDQQP